MRLAGVAALVLMSSGPSFAETVCMNSGANPVTILRAQAIARGILKSAGVRLEFNDNESICKDSGNGIVVVLSYKTRADHHPGALAYALPYQRAPIEVFYDRVRRSVWTGGVPYLLGHVLAHEITHVLQGVDRHSVNGVMKRKWDYHDCVAMQQGPLGFTEEDLFLIGRGLEYRAAGQASSSAAVQ